MLKLYNHINYKKTCFNLYLQETILFEAIIKGEEHWIPWSGKIQGWSHLLHAGINNLDEWVDPGVDQATVQRKLKYKPQGLPQALPDSPPPASPAREEEENVSDVSNREFEGAEREEENVSDVSSPALRRISEIRICYWLAIKLSNNQRIEQQRQSGERNNQNVSPDRQQQPRKTWSLRDSQPQQQHTHWNWEEQVNGGANKEENAGGRQN